MSKVFYVLGTVGIVTCVAIGGWWMGKNKIFERDERPIAKINQVIEKPLEKYTIENLNKTGVSAGEIKIIGDNLFEFYFNPDLDGKTIKKTTGQIRIPDGKGPFPIIVMNRGYVDQEIYQTGVGTNHSSEVFAANGFITIAPDFLGYAGSDSEAQNIFESRFQTYVLVLSLVNSLDQINAWDGVNLFMWGHSNGGQVALTVLEISGKPIPTTLWAPVSKPFPYSILYYTDESEDRGKLIRRELAKFEDLYDTDKYSLDLYLDQIMASVQLHQGTADNAVPVGWSNSLVKSLEGLGKDITYYTYPGADHNMVPVWNTVVTRDVAFFRSHLK